MKELGDFFGKFKKFRLPEEEIRIFVKTICEDLFKINIPFEKISFKNRIIKINTNSVVKNEIHLQKDKILPLIREKFPKYNIDDIN